MVSKSDCSFMPCIATDEISIGLHRIRVEDSRMIINSLLRFFCSTDRHGSVFILSGITARDPFELFGILNENIKSLYVLKTRLDIVPNERPAMPLERLCLDDASKASALSKHVQNGSLSRLTHLSITHKLLVLLLKNLFQKQWPQLTHLTLRDVTEAIFYDLFQVAKQEKLKNISQLSLFFDKSWSLNFFPRKIHFLWSDFLPFLRELTIHWFLTTMPIGIFEEFATIVRRKQGCLHKIDLSHNCLGARLSILLENGFPELHTLILSDCKLNSDDLRSMARAKVKGRIPELRHLDISLNDQICGHLGLLFDNSPSDSWNSLLSLNVERNITQITEPPVCAPDLSFLSTKSSMFGNLRELRVSTFNNKHMRMRSRWGSLTTLQVVCKENSDSRILSSVVLAVEDNLLPRLETVRILTHPKFISDQMEKTTTDALQRNLAILRAANIVVLVYELADEQRLIDVGVNSFPFTQSTPNVGE